MLIIQRPTVEPIGEEEGNRQRFAIGPLEPGFGHTLGVALRRTLLSSIPGAAVTQVRFDEALHEFTTLPGVKEDVTDIILNLKDIVLRMQTDDPVTLRLDVRGPATVTAGDIILTSRRRDPQPRPGASPRVNAKGRLAADSRSSGAGATCRPTATSGPRPSGSSRSTRSSRRSGWWPSPSSRPGWSSRPTTTAWSSTSPPTARSRRARRWPPPATPCAAWSAWWPT